MAKLRHISLSVDDMEKTAVFYEQAFEMKRVRQSNVAIMMSDGVVSLAIIDANKNANAGTKKGLHHVGFLIDDIDATAAKVEQSGGIVQFKTSKDTLGAFGCGSCAGQNKACLFLMNSNGSGKCTGCGVGDNSCTLNPF